MSPHAARQRQSAAPAATDAGLAAAVGALMLEALAFVAKDRGEAIIRRWLSPWEMLSTDPGRHDDMVADAILLAGDLLVGTPSASGSTAFDRLARARPGATSTETAAIAALRRGRFRLLSAPDRDETGIVRLRDMVSRETLHVVGTSLPALPAGLALFARVAPLVDGHHAFAGPITPLDAAGIAVARQHLCAGAQSPAAGARWAEAVYCHVIRHGTPAIPGLNRPAADEGAAAEDPDAYEGGPLFRLARRWSELPDGATPPAELLRETRPYADLPTILDALAAAVLARGTARGGTFATGIERLLVVLLETVAQRARSGAGGLTLEAVAAAVAQEVAAGRAPPAVRATFDSLRQRVAGRAAGGNDRDLERLVQRIQALRAKTVAQGCTEQEALAAAEKVAELLDRYGLSLNELELREQPCEGVGIRTDRRRAAPIDTCIPSIATFFDCRVWIEQAKGAPLRYVFFGLRGDVAAAQYLYELVERAFETETAAFRRGALYAEMEGARRSASNSFQIGLAQGICAKLAQLQEARAGRLRSASGRDLVPVKAEVVEAEMAKLGLNLRRRQLSGSRRVLRDAFAAGQEAGARFEYVAGIAQAG